MARNELGMKTNAISPDYVNPFHILIQCMLYSEAAF